VKAQDVRRQRGFTLLEMIVATLIMGIAVTGLLSGIAGATRNASRVREYDRVAQLAREQMNRLLVDYTIPQNGSIGNNFDVDLTGGMESGWQAQTTVAASSPNPAAGQYFLERIQLEIWWMSGANRRSVMLEGFRKNITQSQGGTQ
jgi:general secretion pathway protein I